MIPTLAPMGRLNSHHPRPERLGHCRECGSLLIPIAGQDLVLYVCLSCDYPSAEIKELIDA